MIRLPKEVRRDLELRNEDRIVIQLILRCSGFCKGPLRFGDVSLGRVAVCDQNPTSQAADCGSQSADQNRTLTYSTSNILAMDGWP